MSKVSFGQLSQGWWIWPVHEYPSLDWDQAEKHQLRGEFLGEGWSQRHHGRISADTGLGIAFGGFLRGYGVTGHGRDAMPPFSFLTETTSSSEASFMELSLISPTLGGKIPSRVIPYKIQPHLIIILKVFLILLLPLSPCQTAHWLCNHKTPGTAVDQYFHVIFHLSP